ncbi:hypothetical protein B0T17DRAFT_588497 [Bombardia bombarda]|uniref:Uncharacterized protein n=1 Tax=Bombardia bombarda TaxID=252184 RepID=A0AA39X6S6_9PEZI|nr:hypothetical protein B0T17DRAFT_588497 [Bombardia bombarda]
MLMLLQGLLQGCNDIAARRSRKLLRSTIPEKQYLPGQPRIRLHDDGQRHDAVNVGDNSSNELLNYLRKSHETKELDNLLPFMRYIFVQTPSFRHIMPLHHQKAHARSIIVNESPELHLVWYYERIFVKPIPAYFYSAAFWEYLDNADQKVYRAAVGFMRSYWFLIQYPIDFDEACNIHKLIPPKPDGKLPTYEEFCDFIEPFKRIGDAFVCRRYHYGELRLTRINRTAFLFKGRLAYFHIYPQWGSFLAHILAPVITVFAVCSVVLNSMQVSLAALAMGVGPDFQVSGWPSFIGVSLYFPIAVIVLIALVIVAAGFGVMKQGDPDAGEKSHGMVW